MGPWVLCGRTCFLLSPFKLLHMADQFHGLGDCETSIVLT
jgi:hypothetical protein